MSNHNPHGHLSQPNSSWNPLQIPSFIPRQPQLAHMSNERSLSRSPLTWHTPTPPEAIYNFLSANHKTLDLNPLIPPFVRDQNHFGSVDLTLQSSAAKHNTPLLLPDTNNQLNTNLFRNMQNSNVGKNFDMDKTNNVELNDKTDHPISGGLFIKDTKQINEDFVKNKAKITETEDLIQQKPVELVKENHHYNNINNASGSPKNFRNAPNSGSTSSLSPSSKQNINANLTTSPVKKTSNLGNFESVIISENSSTATSNEDSVDSNLSKNKRKRKQGKTNKVLATNCNNTDDNLPTTLTELESRNKLICNLTNNVKTLNLDNLEQTKATNVESTATTTTTTTSGSSKSTTSSNVADLILITKKKEQSVKTIPEDKHPTDLVTKTNLLMKNLNENKSKELNGKQVTQVNHTRPNLDTDDVETIDKIAEMIAAGSGTANIPPSESVKQNLTVSKLNNISSIDNSATKVHSISSNNFQTNSTIIMPQKSNNGITSELPNTTIFEEVENRMEEMFAGIEDVMLPECSNQPVSYVMKNPATIESNVTTTINHKLELIGTQQNQLNEMKQNTGLIVETTNAAQKQLHSSKNNINSNKKKKKTMKKTMAQKSNTKSKNKSVKTKQKLTPTPLKTTKNKDETLISIDNNNKYKSPYIQLKLDGTTCVINTPLAEDDAEKQNKLKKPIFNHNKLERNKIRGLHVSTLSNKYDADTTDTSWLCVFCKKGPHKYGLGDLFGPYIVSTECEEFEICKNFVHNDEFKSNRTKADMYKKNMHSYPVVPATATLPSTHLKNTITHNSINERKRKIIPDETQKTNNNIFSGMIKVSETSYEVWVHEDCIVWASGIYLIGSKLVGLEASVWNSSRNKCTICLLNGAMICCLQRDCKEVTHLCCAKSRCWTLSENNFKTFCQNHSILV